MAETSVIETIQRNIRPAFYIGLSACCCTVMIQENGAFYNSLKLSQQGFPTWGGFALAILFELVAISYVLSKASSRDEKVFKWIMLVGLFAVSVSGSIFLNIKPLLKEEIKVADKVKLDSLKMQVESMRDALKGFNKVKFPSRYALLVEDYNKALKEHSDFSSKVKTVSASGSMTGSSEVAWNIILRLLIQISAWYLPVLAFRKNEQKHFVDGNKMTQNADKIRQNQYQEYQNRFTDSGGISEMVLKEVEVEAQRSVTAKYEPKPETKPEPDFDGQNDSQKKSSDILNLSEKEQKILEYLNGRGRFDYTKLTQSNLRKVFKNSSQAIYDCLIGLSEKGLVILDCPEDKPRAVWTVERSV